MPQRAVDAALGELGVAETAILVAVSGGVDSVVLLDALAELRRPRAIELVVGHVNHGLRGQESDADEALAREHAGRLELPFLCEAVRPEALREGRPSGRRPTLQEAARQLRYAALRRMAARAGSAYVATAHNADDQAETVLMRLLRGCGPDGLGGIPEQSRDGRVIRPLLACSRIEIEAFARDRRLEWREDPSNRSPRYARSRLRGRWLPGLTREFNPQLLRAIGQLAETHRRDAEWIEDWIDDELGRCTQERPGGTAIFRAGWAERPLGLRRRLLRQLWTRAGGGREMSRRHLARMDAFVREGRSGAEMELPRGFRIVAGHADVTLRAPAGAGDPAC